MDLITQPLNKRHEKKDFNCGYSLLDNYLKTQAKQDVSRDLSAYFVLSNQNIVVGYYTLSSNSIARDEFPDDISRKLPPSYENLPGIFLGRIAVDSRYQGKGYGEVLLFDALKRCMEISYSLGSLAVIVDPIDTKAEKFYQRYGFILFPGSRKMFIPLKTLKELFKDDI